MILEYITDRLVDQVCREISSGAIALLQSHALIKAQAKEYVRASQSRLILKPVAERLLAAMGQAGLEAQLKTILGALRQAEPRQLGYAGGNLLHLLLHLKSTLRDYDFSGVTLRQVYLGGLHVPDLNFAGAHLAEAVFTDTFGPTFAVAFSPNGNVLAAGTAEGQVRLWRVSDGQPLLTCEGHVGAVWSVAFSPDGSLLASGIRVVAQDPRCSETLLRDAFEAAGRRAAHQLDRYLNALATIASAAPLLGLFFGSGEIAALAVFWPVAVMTKRCACGR